VNVKKAAADYGRAQAAAARARQLLDRAIRDAVATGVTRTELADELGVSRQAISKRLRGSA
jgi:DNA-binding transcriptional regulator LsrR (DeoR family)